MKIKTIGSIIVFLLYIQISIVNALEIAIEDADTTWNTTTTYSPDMTNITSNVTPRIITEYANTIYRNNLTHSTNLYNIMSNVKPRIITEYTNTIYRNNLTLSTNLLNVMSSVAPRILVEYANSIYRNDLNEIPIIIPNQPPTPSFTYSLENPVINQVITFNASNSTDFDGTITSYEWNFGDGNITNTTDEIITHLYSSAGNYSVMLTVTDNDGAKGYIQKQITITEPYCGDNICNNEETCTTCPQDCGVCIDTTVFGTIYDSMGSLAVNADVTITCNPNTPYETSISTTTDNNGAYTADMTTCTDGSPLLITALKNNYPGQTTGTMDYYSMNIYDITLSGTEIPVFPLQILAPLLTLLSLAIMRPKR